MFPKHINLNFPYSVAPIKWCLPESAGYQKASSVHWQGCLPGHRPPLATPSHLPDDEEDERGTEHQCQHVAEGREGECHGRPRQPCSLEGREGGGEAPGTLLSAPLSLSSPLWRLSPPARPLCSPLPSSVCPRRLYRLGGRYPVHSVPGPAAAAPLLCSPLALLLHPLRLPASLASPCVILRVRLAVPQGLRMLTSVGNFFFSLPS